MEIWSYARSDIILKHYKTKREMEVYILFETDAWKSDDSRICMGVFDSHEKAFEEFCRSVFYGERNLDSFEKAEMIGACEEDIEEGDSVSQLASAGDYNSAECYIATTTLNEFNEV